MKRWAAYGRFSDDGQNESSAADQIEKCKQFIERHGGIIVNSSSPYADEAITGRRNDRVEFERLIEDAALGKFDVVVAEALDRFSRDQADIALFHKHMQYYGVAIYTVDEGEINELHIGMKGTMNALFSVDLAKKVRRGMDEAINAGKCVGRRPYGYRIRRELDCNGEPLRHKKGRLKSGFLEIDPDEAEIVVQIFIWFSEGVSPIEIARRLNKKRIAGPYGKKWTAHIIRGNSARAEGILNLELYNGKRYWGKTIRIRDPKTGKTKNRWKEKSEWQVFEVPHLKVVTHDLWLSVKAKQEEINYVTERNYHKNHLTAKRRSKYLLSGKMECGVCGNNFNIISTPFCGCSNNHEGAGCEIKKRIKYHDIEQAVLTGITDILLAPDRVEKFLEYYKDEYERQLSAFNSEQGQLKKEVQKVQSKIEAIMRAIENGVFNQYTQSRLLELEADKAKIESQYTTLKPQELPSKAKINEYRKKIQNFSQSIADPEIKSAALGALRPYISRVVLTPTETGWHGVMRGKIGALIGIRDCPDADIILPL